MSNSLLITGTDTDVGKTFVTISLVTYWQKYQLNTQLNNIHRLGLLKLLQTGTGDREIYQSLFGDEDFIEVNTPICFNAPLAPPIAAAKEGKIIDLDIVWQAFRLLQEKNDLVLVEALGGLGSPVTAELTVAHLAADWHIPIILVVPVRLGAIAQTVANVALAKSLNINLRGIILNCSEPKNFEELANLTPVDLIQSLTQVPILGILPFIDNFTEKDKLAKLVSNWELELIFS